jgi:hypothetical protein
VLLFIRFRPIVGQIVQFNGPYTPRNHFLAMSKKHGVAHDGSQMILAIIPALVGIEVPA